MPVPSLPINLAAHTSAKAADVQADLDYLEALLTGGAASGLDGDNFHYGAVGQLWVPDAGGKFVRKTVGGDLTMDAAGNFTIVDGAVNEGALVSPANAVYKNLLVADGILHSQPLADTYLLGTTGATFGMSRSGGNVNIDGAPPRLLHLIAADYAVGLTTKLRLRAQVAADSVAPNITFTFGLYPLTVAGGGGAVAYTAGALVAASAVPIATPAASTVTRAVSADFDLPANGVYVLAVATSGLPVINSVVSCHAQLQMRNVV